MKKILITAVFATQLLSLSSMASASESLSVLPGAEPAESIVLSAAQMDDVTAGAWGSRTSLASVFQINISPVTVVQIGVLNFGGQFNLAQILSGNLSGIL